MAYQAIYRRFRPTVFDDVVGQEHITKTLKNQIINGSTAHAYLFCGTRGTGKTSTAKILARAVNCLNPKDGNPCNECEVCRGLLDESILDVAELDGASKNKIENIRDIIDDVVFLPSVAKKKVYIIDEVHMVTQQAFNALLKTLEEPPAHVMFILATTELNKVPITVLSRCQQFEFRRITNKDIAERMETILAKDGITAEKTALSLIAELGDGSMRDSLSILDKCVGATDGHLTYDDVVKVVGIADNEALFDISCDLAEGNSKGALKKLDEVIEKGKELGLFAERLIKYLRDVLVVKITGDADTFLNTSEENVKKITELSGMFSRERLIRGIDILNDCYAGAKFTSFSRTLYEMAIVKICEPEIEESFQAMKDRICALEQKIKEGVVSVKTEEKKETPPEEIKETPKPEESKKPKEEPKEELKKEPVKKDAGTDDASARFPEIIEYVKTHGGMPLFPHLMLVKTKMSGGKLCIIFGDNAIVSKSLVSKPNNLALIKEAVKSVMGKEIDVACVTPKEIGEDDNPLKKLEELSKTHSEIQFI